MTSIPPELEGIDQMPDDRRASKLVGERAQLVRRREPRSLAVTIIANEVRFRNATASVEDMGDHWWVSRVWICPDWRRKGVGRFLVAELLSMVKDRGGKKVVVAPGGYNMKYKDQRAFYEACGFTQVEPGWMEIVW
jgi:GNAT superfamily N-acetyltransferase